MRGSDTLEVAFGGPETGRRSLLTLAETGRSAGVRRDDETCLTCHLTWDTLGVPGLVVMSVFSVPAADDKYWYTCRIVADQRSSSVNAGAAGT